MSMIKHIPGFFVIGLNDREDRVQGFRTAEKYYKEHGLNGLFHFKKGYGHEWIMDLEKDGFDFLLKHKRVKYLKEFDGFAFYYGDQKDEKKFLSEVNWVQVVQCDFSGTAFHVKVKDNHISIIAPNEGRNRKLKRANLFLNDKIVNLDEPVKVTVNEKEVFNERVERSVEFLLDWFEERRDSKRLFCNSVELWIGR